MLTPKTFSPVGPSSGPSFIPFGGSSPIDAANLPHDPLMPELEDTAEIQSTGIFGNAYDDHDLETLNTPYADQSVMDVKSAFLYGTIEEEVYVCQPLGFVDPEFLEKVYKVEKALYGLHQAPRAWYETLSTYLLDNGFHRGQIDKTLFIKRLKGDILLVQVYVDDIIFGSTKKSLCDEFEQIMHNRFQMSLMGELTFFLGIASTPMETNKALTKDEDGEDVDVHLYRSMIGSLMYLTSSRPDIMFSVCACSRFQVQPKVSHLNAVKRIFRYLKGQPKLGLWYPKDSPLILEAFSDSDYAGASLDRKSTTGGCQFLGSRLISWQCKKQTVVANSTTKAKYIAASHCYLLTKAFDVSCDFISGGKQCTATARTSASREVELTAKIDGQVKTITEASLRRHLKLEDIWLVLLPSTNSEIFEDLLLLGNMKGPKAKSGGIDAEERLGGFLPTREDTALADAAKRRRSVETAQTYTRLRRSVSTGSGRVSTASRTVSTADVSTASELGSTAGVKAKDKGKAIMQESEVLKRSKKRVQYKQEQERINFEAALELQKYLKCLRYHAQLNRPYSIAEVRKNMVMYWKNQGGYKMNYFKGMKYEDIRPIFEKVWDQIQSFAPMDSKKEKDSEMKGSRKKEEIIARNKSKLLSSKNYKRSSVRRLDDFDRLGCLDLHRLVKARYMTSSPEGYDLMLWEIFEDPI
ncbi:putative ribonuclease H-like domain-containing protein [Tanacetum coccineum]